MPANSKSPWRAGLFGDRSPQGRALRRPQWKRASGLHRVAAGCRRIRQGPAPHTIAGARSAIALVHLTAQAHDVRSGLELKLFDDAKALAVAVLEC